DRKPASARAAGHGFPGALAHRKPLGMMQVASWTRLPASMGCNAPVRCRSTMLDATGKSVSSDLDGRNRGGASGAGAACLFFQCDMHVAALGCNRRARGRLTRGHESVIVR